MGAEEKLASTTPVFVVPAKTPEGLTIWIAKDDRFLVEQAAKRIMAYQGPLQIVVDLGAHVGVVSLAAATRGAKVYAFEPSPINVQLLRTNANENGLATSIVIHSLAITVQTGDEMPLLRANNPNSTGQRSLCYRDDMGAFPVEQYVKTLSLKDLLKRVLLIEGRIDYLKCDIEGGEYLFVALTDPELEALMRNVGHVEMSIHPLGDHRYFFGPAGNYVTLMEDWLESCVPGRWEIVWEKEGDREEQIRQGGGSVR